MSCVNYVGLLLGYLIICCANAQADFIFKVFMESLFDGVA